MKWRTTTNGKLAKDWRYETNMRQYRVRNWLCVWNCDLIRKIGLLFLHEVAHDFDPDEIWYRSWMRLLRNCSRIIANIPAFGGGEHITQIDVPPLGIQYQLTGLVWFVEQRCKPAFLFRFQFFVVLMMVSNIYIFQYLSRRLVYYTQWHWL